MEPSSTCISYEVKPIDFDILARELIENLRISSDLKYVECCEFVDVVISTVSSQIRSNELSKLLCSVRKDVLDVSNCYDAKQLRRFFNLVSDWCTDHQERNWSVLDDDALMVDKIDVLNSLLEKADNRVSLFVLSEDDYESLNNLVKLYQMETVLRVRIALLKTLKLSCRLSPTIPYILLSTVLPTELVQDFINDQTISPEKTLLTVDLLTHLFCTDQRIPTHLYDTFNVEFVNRILDRIEATDSSNETLSFSLVNFLISFNLHQVDSEDNVIIKALETRSVCKKFVERIFFLTNKGDETVWVYKTEPNPHGFTSLMMLISLFNNPCTAGTIYSNDVRVLFDIIRREVLNRQPGKIRNLFYHLLMVMLINADVDEILNDYRSDVEELVKLLHKSTTDDDPSQADVLKILDGFAKLGYV